MISWATKKTLAVLGAALALMPGCAAGRLEGEGAGQIKVEFWTPRAAKPAADLGPGPDAPGLGHIGRRHHQDRQEED